MSDMKERLHTGELYYPEDEEITREQRIYQDLLYEYNQTKPSEESKRAEMLKKILGSCGNFGGDYGSNIIGG